MIKLSSLALLAGVVSACATDDVSTAPTELAPYGITDVSRSGNVMTLLDAKHARIGEVTATSDSLDVTLREVHAGLAWDASTATITCNGQTSTLATATADGWQLAPQPDTTLAVCNDALAVAGIVSDLEGEQLPWLHDELAWSKQHRSSYVEGYFEMEQTCVNVSTSALGDCGACFSRACRAAYGQGNWFMCNESGTSTCDAGIIWSSCNVTYCN